MHNNKFLNHIKLGDYVEAIIHVITLGYGTRIASFIAVDLMGKKDCGCCRRKEILNRLTNPKYDGHCNQVKLF